jgi:hypothetical protein
LKLRLRPASLRRFPKVSIPPCNNGNAEYQWIAARIGNGASSRPRCPTARTPKSVALVKDDIEYQIRAGFCRVFLWDDIVKMCPKNLKISPVAVLPQVNRCGRIILDLSFPVYQAVDGVVTVTQKSVNDSTVLPAPSQSVKEIRKVLPRLLQY